METSKSVVKVDISKNFSDRERYFILNEGGLQGYGNLCKNNILANLLVSHYLLESKKVVKRGSFKRPSLWRVSFFSHLKKGNKSSCVKISIFC